MVCGHRIAKNAQCLRALHVLRHARVHAKITAEERKIAIQSAKIMGLKVAGVDIIRSASGPKVLEINSSPGLEGIESVSGLDIAGLMIESIEKSVVKKRLKIAA